MMTREKREHLEREVVQYREQVSSLQDRLDSVTKVRVEELNNTLLNSCFTHKSLSWFPVFSTYPDTAFIISLFSLPGV